MKSLLATSFALVAFGIPAVAKYFPYETDAVITAFETVNLNASVANTASAVEGFWNMADTKIQAAPASIQDQPTTESHTNSTIYPPRLIQQ